MQSIQETLEKFMYPNSLIKEYDHWYVLLRPKQVTKGSLIVIIKEEVHSFKDLSTEAYIELKAVYSELETVLKSVVDNQKVNYMALMMVDPQVHTHVIPRYEGARKLGDTKFEDKGWPKLPAMTEALSIEEYDFDSLKAEMIKGYESL